MTETELRQVLRTYTNPYQRAHYLAFVVENNTCLEGRIFLQLLIESNEFFHWIENKLEI